MHKEERFNSITYTVGAVAALAGLVMLVVLASNQGDPWKIVSFSIYGVTLFLLCLILALYHGLGGRAKNLIQMGARVFPWLFICVWPFGLDRRAIHVVLVQRKNPGTVPR